MWIADCRHRVTPIDREGASTVAHHTPNIVRYIKVTNLSFRPKREANDAFGSNVFPIDSNILVAIERVLHVMEAKGMNELVDNCEEPETASVDSVGLQSNSLRASYPANHCSTAHRVASNENVIVLSGAMREREARSTFKECGSRVNVIDLITICNSPTCLIE